MRTTSFILMFWILFSGGYASAVAAEASFPEVVMTAPVQSYDTYKRLLKEWCDDATHPWNDPQYGDPFIVAPPTYSELSTAALNASISRTQTAENLPSEKTKLSQELDPTRIGNFTGLKSLEIARIQYRSAMNNIFACAIIDARTEIIVDLQKKIAQTFPWKNTEIKNQLEKEEKKLRATRNELPCKTRESTSTTQTEMLLANTITRQYCHYHTYLQYLEDNVTKSNDQVARVEQWVGAGNSDNLPTTSEGWIQVYNLHNGQLQRELERSTRSLPLALRTFQEMKRTYAIHVMLTIIYDDYILLRDNLNRYLNTTSQIFEKVNNAMTKK